MQTNLPENTFFQKNCSLLQKETRKLDNWPDLDCSEQIQIIRAGLSALQVDVLAKRLGLPRKDLCSFLKISTSTISRLIIQGRKLDSAQSERLLNVFLLIKQVEQMVEHSGSPDEFDAGIWLGIWLKSPLLALDGASPGGYLDTNTGISLISNMIACMESGAYV